VRCDPPTGAARPRGRNPTVRTSPSAPLRGALGEVDATARRPGGGALRVDPQGLQRQRGATVSGRTSAASSRWRAVTYASSCPDPGALTTLRRPRSPVVRAPVVRRGVVPRLGDDPGPSAQPHPAVHDPDAGGSLADRLAELEAHHVPAGGVRDLDGVRVFQGDLDVVPADRLLANTDATRDWSSRHGSCPSSTSSCRSAGCSAVMGSPVNVVPGGGTSSPGGLWSPRRPLDVPDCWLPASCISVYRPRTRASRPAASAARGDGQPEGRPPTPGCRDPGHLLDGSARGNEADAVEAVSSPGRRPACAGRARPRPAPARCRWSPRGR
jgi:hypothetical protein